MHLSPPSGALGQRTSARSSSSLRVAALAVALLSASSLASPARSAIWDVGTDDLPLRTSYGATSKFTLADYITGSELATTFALKGCDASYGDYYDSVTVGTAGTDAGKLVVVGNEKGHVHAEGGYTTCRVTATRDTESEDQAFTMNILIPRTPPPMGPFTLQGTTLYTITVRTFKAYSYVYLTVSDGGDSTGYIVRNTTTTSDLTFPGLTPGTTYTVRGALLPRELYHLWGGSDDDSAGVLVPQVAADSKWKGRLRGGKFSPPLSATTDPLPVVTLNLTPVSISENGGVATVTASLDIASDAATSITVAATPEAPAVSDDFRLSANTTLTIAAGNTSSTGEVTITAVDNAMDAPDKLVTVSGAATDSTGVTAPADVSLTILDDDDPPQVTLNLAPASIPENGGVATVTASLDIPSDAATSVTVAATPEAPALSEDFQLSANTTLTIAAGNTSSTGEVTITAVDNAVDADDKSVTVSGTATNSTGVRQPGDVALTIVDDDVAPPPPQPPPPTPPPTPPSLPTVTLSAAPNPVAEGSPVTVTASLSRALENDVVIPLALTLGTAEAGDFGSLASVTIAGGRTEGAGTITTARDVDTDDETFTVALGALPSSVEAGSPASVRVTIRDEDEDDENVDGSVLVEPLELTVVENGAAAHYTVRLGAKPKGPVTVTTGNGDPGTLTVAPRELTFGVQTWNTAQSVTVQAVDDHLMNGNRAVSVSHAAAGGGYDGVRAPTVEVNVVDDDDRSPIRTSEEAVTLFEGGERSVHVYTVVLAAAPLGEIQVEARSQDPEIAVVAPAVLTFGPTTWSVPQQVELRAMDDDIDNPSDRTTVVTHEVNGGHVERVRVSVTVVDDDVAGVELSPTDLTMAEGGEAAYTVKLATEPLGVVTVRTASDTPSASVQREFLTFTPLDWNRPQSVPVRALDDDIDSPSDVLATIGHAVEGYGEVVDGGVVTAVIEDDDVAGVVLSTTRITVAEAAPGNREQWTAVLTSEPVGVVTLTAEVADLSVGSLEQGSVTFAPADWRTPRAFTVVGVDDDIVNLAPRRTVISHRPAGGGYDEVEVDSIALTVEDDGDDLRRERGAALTASLAGLARTMASDAVDVITDRLDQTTLSRLSRSSAPGGAQEAAAAAQAAPCAEPPRRLGDGEETVARRDRLRKLLAELDRRIERGPANRDLEERLRRIRAELDRNGLDCRFGDAEEAQSPGGERTAGVVAAVWRPDPAGDGGGGVSAAGPHRRVTPAVEQVAFDERARRTSGGARTGSREGRLQMLLAELGRRIDDGRWNRDVRGASLGGRADRLQLLLAELGRRGVDWRFGGDGAGPRGGVWSRVTNNTFAAQALGRRVDGDLVTGYLGVDVLARENLLLGVAASHSRSELSVSGALASDVDTSLTVLQPYGRWRFARGDLWGLAGAGRGRLDLVDVAGEERTDLSLRLAAVGGSVDLCRRCGPGGSVLALRTDAFQATIEADEEALLDATRARAERARLMIDGRWRLASSESSSLSVSGEFGARWDGGHADGGMGAEIGGELTWAHLPTGLTLEASGRYTPVHQARVFRDWGFGLSLGVAPQAGGRGASFRLGPSWGTPESGVHGLWSGGFPLDTLAFLGPPHRREDWRPDSFEADFGYRWITGSGPIDLHAALSDQSFGSREYLVGASLSASERFALRFAADFARREGLREDWAVLFSLRRDGF